MSGRYSQIVILCRSTADEGAHVAVGKRGHFPSVEALAFERGRMNHPQGKKGRTAATLTKADGVVHAQAAEGPQTHVLIIGVGRYPYFRDGGAEANPLAPLGQLKSSTVSARLLAKWFIDEYHYPPAPVGSLALLCSERSAEPFLATSGAKLLRTPDYTGFSAAANELRVCAARSRRTNSVGRTRGVGERMGLWRFHPGRSLSGVMIAGQKERREERDPRITVESVTFCTVDGVIWGMVRDIGWGGDKGFP